MKRFTVLVAREALGSAGKSVERRRQWIAHARLGWARRRLCRGMVGLAKLHHFRRIIGDHGGAWIGETG
ncbi:MAG: hypothetical protein WBQ72_23035, partial [Terriglobales bacterium]